MSTFTIKLIAIITMLIDHIGAVFVPQDTMLYLAMRIIGRLAFPIFVFLVVEGFYHTRNVKKYLMRMGLFLFVSEIPFDLAFYGKILDNRHQNVYFTLFLGLLLITLMRSVENKFEKKIIVSNILDVLLVIGFYGIAKILNTDYGAAGILLIVTFYLFRGSKALLTLSIIIITGTMLSDMKQFFITGNIFAVINMLAVFGIIPIAFYNGKKGKDVKYIFYIFYPAHLLIIYLINYFY